MQPPQDPDRLSSLPDPILHQILSHPHIDTREVVQTCILSKRFIHLWKSMPNLLFDQHRFLNESTYKYKTNEFINFINQIILGREDHNIDKFSLTISELQNGYQLEKWVTCAVLYGAQFIHLESLDLDFDDTILGHVKNLQLTSVYFPLIMPSSQRERYMYLEKVESLIIEDCDYWTIRKLTIDAPLVNYLMIENDNYARTSVMCGFDLKAPNVRELVMKGYLYGDYRLGNMGNLVKADVSIETKEMKKREFWEFGKCLDKILRGICNVKSLTLSVEPFQISAELPKELRLVSKPFNNLRYLKLTKWHMDGHIGAVGKLLERFPFVETLVLERTKTKFDREMEGDWGAELSFQCMFPHLKTIEVRNLDVCENELKFLGFLLENAMVLENITIKEMKVSSEDKEKELADFCKKLHLLNKASSSVTILLMLKRETGLTIAFKESSGLSKDEAPKLESVDS